MICVKFSDMEDEELDGNGKRLRFRLRVLEERLHGIRGHLVTDGRGGLLRLQSALMSSMTARLAALVAKLAL